MKKLIDLSHTVEHGMITYKGIPGPIICDFLSREASKAHYAEGTTFHIGRIDMVANTGTYIDAPFHRYAEGKDISELALEGIADLEGVVCPADATSRAIGPELFSGVDVKGKAVLVHTGWAQHWGSESYFEGHLFLTAEAAELLQVLGAALVGIDSLNIDDTSGGERPVHSTLLASMITSKPAIDDHPKTGQRRGDRDRVVLAFCLLVKQVHFGSPTARTAL